jgi:tRNA A-37 threonylcarbamoyl transferase component Bud32
MMAATPDPALLATLRGALDSTYEIEREIGGGGMSRVFLATERALGRRVVIKVLPPELTAGVNRERFRREIQFAARLQHPHIVPLLTAGQVGDILYYTMPFVEGETLRLRLEHDGPLPAAQVVAVLQDVVDALAYAHSQGLVHRDIKPENILLQRSHAVVTDFGVAKAISESLPGTAATTVGVAVGTPAYMAPEQLAADPAADHRIDLYAVGLLAYELLSGSSPFAGSSPQQTLARQLTERPTPPHLQRADVPPVLSAIIMRCLEKEPAARYASADELLGALGEVRITSSGMRAVSRTLAMDLTRPGSARRMLILAGGVALAVALAAVAYAYWQPSPRAASMGSLPALAPSDSAAGVPGDTAHRPLPTAHQLTPTDTAGSSRQLLTRADSDAIAAAVSRRLSQRKAPAPAPGVTQKELDSIRMEVQRLVTDSVMRMFASARVGIKVEPGGKGMGVLPGLPVPGEIWHPGEKIRGGPIRLVLQDVLDRTGDTSQAALARAVTDSLVGILGHLPGIHVVSGEPVRAALKRGVEPTALGATFGADAVVMGYLQPRGDSIRLYLVLRDPQHPVNNRSIRSARPRSESAGLPRALADQLTGWLEKRQAARQARSFDFNFNTFDRAALDSVLRDARRIRDSVRRRPQPRPDSPPKPPIP